MYHYHSIDKYIAIIAITIISNITTPSHMYGIQVITRYIKIVDIMVNLMVVQLDLYKDTFHIKNTREPQKESMKFCICGKKTLYITMYTTSICLSANY